MRYNIFNHVHKGLRAMLYETALLLQQTDFNNEAELAVILPQVRLVIDLFEKHAHTEDNFVFKAIGQYEPSVVDAFEKEHDEDLAIGHRIQELLDQLESGDQRGDKTTPGAALGEAFSDFLIFNLRHMAHEELIINPLLWRYYSDEELKQISRSIKANTAPATMLHHCKWMLHGLNFTELTSWFASLKEEVNRLVFYSLMQMAEKELAASKWQQLKELFSSDLETVHITQGNYYN